ncbi:hypothetical protein VTN00DRAFT_1919 [Thermoascus crustaceus]|uniref:uncharacterized protein n=1 Tax=Thermoascus crustaceus TaxID=5088 RepID=UPI003741EA86
MSSKLLDTEPGGESRQYESIQEFTKPRPKQSGQLGANAEHTVSEIKTLLPESDEQERERRDSLEDGQETTVEDGFGGKTNNVSGEVDKDLKPDNQGIDEAARRSRRQQRYGPGSGVGA